MEKVKIKAVALFFFLILGCAGCSNWLHDHDKCIVVRDGRYELNRACYAEVQSERQASTLKWAGSLIIIGLLAVIALNTSKNNSSKDKKDEKDIKKDSDYV